MSTPLQVLYNLNIGGNLNAKLDEAKRKLLDVGATAGKVAKDLNSNALLSNFESVASILTQMGGTVAQVGIIASTAARPVTILGQTFGAAAVGAVGLAAGAVLLAGSLVKASTATKEWLDGMVKVRKELVEQGYLTDNAALSLLEFEKASTRLDVSLKKLKVSIADDLAPAFTDFVNSATGFVRLLGDIEKNGMSARAALVGLTTVLLGPAGLTIAGLGNEGSINDGRMLTGDPRALLAPLARPKVGSSFDMVGGNTIDPRSLLYPLQAPGSKPADLLGDLAKQMAEAAAREAALNAAPGRQVLAGIAGVRAGGAGSSIFEGGGTVSELEEQLWTSLFEDWLKTPSQKFEQSAEELGSAVETFKLSSEGLSGLTSGISGGGVSGVLQAAGPIGMIAGAILQAFKDPTVFTGLFNEVSNIYKNLPEMVGTLAEVVLPSIVRNLPDMLASFVTLAPDFAAALVEAAPEMFAAVVEAILMLPKAFADAIGGVLKNIGDAFNPFQSKDSDPFRTLKTNFGKSGRFGTNLGSDAERKRILGINLPQFETGGMMQHDGPAMLHAGERVLNRSETRAYNSSVGTINVYGATDARRFTEELQQKLGSYGLGLSITPQVGG